MSTAERWEQGADEMPFPVAMLLSLLLSALLVLVVFACAPRPPRPVPTPPPIRVVMVQIPSVPVPVAPPPEALEPPPPPPPVPIEIPAAPSATIALPPRRPAVARPQRVTRAHLARHAEKPVPQETPAPPAAPPAAQAAPSRPAPSDRAAKDSLEARIKQAIQSSMRYPEAAREMGQQGTALVAFVYRDREVHDVRILRSSRFASLDAAALEAVRDAGMPPPGDLAGRELALVVPVVFDLSESDD